MTWKKNCFHLIRQCCPNYFKLVHYKIFSKFSAGGTFRIFTSKENGEKPVQGCECHFFTNPTLIFCIPFHHGSLTFEKYVPPKFVGFRSKHLRSKDKRGFIGRVTNCQKDKNHNSWNFYNRSKVIPVTWQSIVCSASKKFFHSRQMGQWELISNFPIFQHQYQTTGCMVIIIRKMEK